MADDTERNSQLSGQKGSQSDQQGQKHQPGQSRQGEFDESKKGGQKEEDNENLDRQRRAS
jgi:hypothetical protein